MKYELVPCSWLSPIELIHFQDAVKVAGETCNPLWEMESIGVAAWMKKVGSLSMTEHEHYLAFLVEDKLVGVCRITPQPNHQENGQVGIYILPIYRGRMYAVPLLMQISEYCGRIGIEHPTACCDISNHRATAAFKRAGWKPTQKFYNWTMGRTAIELTTRS